jgi:CubicO group peptidase (beta-lactamase class C family)
VLWEGSYGLQDVGRNISTRIDTPYAFDDQTQILTTVLVLRCVEEGKVALSDLVGQYDPASPDWNVSIAQLLNHTSVTPTGAIFSYRPARLAPLAAVLRICTGDPTLRVTMATLLDRVAMRDSVPGLDAISAPDSSTSTSTLSRYLDVFRRLATPYAVSGGQPTASAYASTTLTPWTGLISTVGDYERFDLALKKGVLLQPETLAAAWRAPLDGNGLALPHGTGWFVQSYKGETIVWQFGVSDNRSSSLVMMLPARGVTMILAANSDGLVRPLSLASGDLTVSPFGRLFLGSFVR